MSSHLFRLPPEGTVLFFLLFASSSQQVITGPRYRHRLFSPWHAINNIPRAPVPLTRQMPRRAAPPRWPRSQYLVTRSPEDHRPFTFRMSDSGLFPSGGQRRRQCRQLPESGKSPHQPLPSFTPHSVPSNRACSSVTPMVVASCAYR